MTTSLIRSTMLVCWTALAAASLLAATTTTTTRAFVFPSTARSRRTPRRPGNFWWNDHQRGARRRPHPQHHPSSSIRTTTRLRYRTTSDGRTGNNATAAGAAAVAAAAQHPALDGAFATGRGDDRFARTAPRQSVSERPCVLTVDGVRYNVTAWAKAHPGGVKVLQKFNGRDATQAFAAAHHSAQAVAMLREFRIADAGGDSSDDGKSAVAVAGATTTATVTATAASAKRTPRWRAKLFTKEDPIGVHKYLGAFCLLHFAVRFAQMLVGDPSAGLGTRLGRGPSAFALACLIPHALLSVSSLIFRTVPRDRVVGKPMIWSEFRGHNIVFGLRSVAAAAVAALRVRGRLPARAAVALSAAACLAALAVADAVTDRLRSNALESTTATMPYWDGCSVATQKRFKSFYAYSQFMATLACLAVANPAWPLACLLAIQLASLLMTLVRKGLLSARGYHYLYTAALVLPYLVVARSALTLGGPGRRDLVALFAAGWTAYQLRRRGVNKYALWLPVVAARVWFGDRFLAAAVW